MKKIFLILFFGLILNFNANATILDFNDSGDNSSNQILKDFILKTDMIDETTEVISYFYDIDNDNKNEILGIIKSRYFYSLAGYKLFVLKENNSIWQPFKSDIYFDNSQTFEIKNKKITYHKSIFYKNKKRIAKIKTNKITTKKSFFDYFKNKKAKSIEEITQFNNNTPQNNFELENFNAQNQRDVKINYKNLSDRTKHYLDLK